VQLGFCVIGASQVVGFSNLRDKRLSAADFSWGFHSNLSSPRLTAILR
jgi:hypothetical protein